jgi:hypothetical protein
LPMMITFNNLWDRPVFGRSLMSSEFLNLVTFKTYIALTLNDQNTEV